MRCDVLGHEATIGLWYLATGFNPALHMRWKRGGVEEICVLGLLVEGGAIGGGVDWEGKGKG
jgi:hypothetical protein